MRWVWKTEVPKHSRKWSLCGVANRQDLRSTHPVEEIKALGLAPGDENKILGSNACQLLRL